MPTPTSFLTSLFRVLTNATNGNDAQVKYLVEQGTVQALCRFMGCSDAKINLVVLEGVKSVLAAGQNLVTLDTINQYMDIVEECGGLDEIEKLQHHDNKEVRRESRRVQPTVTHPHAFSTPSPHPSLSLPLTFSLSVQVHTLAVQIITEFFECEEETALPAVNLHTNQFTFGSAFTTPEGNFSF